MPSKEEVRYIAHLSRIHLQGQEVEYLRKDLESILDYMKKLEKLDVKSIQPTTHVLPLKNVFREDVVCPSLKQEEVMKISVASAKGFFQVPQVIE